MPTPAVTTAARAAAAVELGESSSTKLQAVMLPLTGGPAGPSAALWRRFVPASCVGGTALARLGALTRHGTSSPCEGKSHEKGRGRKRQVYQLRLSPAFEVYQLRLSPAFD